MTIDHSKLKIRISEQADAPYLKEWLLAPGVLKWFPMINEAEVDDSIRIWLSYISRKATFTMTLEDKPCGMLVLYLHNLKKILHQTLFAIVVDEKHRGKGIGTELMNYSMKAAKENFNIETLHLEVYEGNPVVSLYDRLGFEVYGKHPNFLKDSDGSYLTKILMQKKLS